MLPTHVQYYAFNEVLSLFFIDVNILIKLQHKMSFPLNEVGEQRIFTTLKTYIETKMQCLVCLFVELDTSKSSLTNISSPPTLTGETIFEQA